MSFKEELQKRIEKGAIKSELDGEVVYLKKSKIPLIGDWARIYPPINEDGSINWMNLIFGGKKNFLKLMIFLAIAFMVLFAFKEVFSSFEAFRNQPCVRSCIEIVTDPIINPLA